MSEILKAVALATTVGVSSCSAQAPLPNREDCIVKFDLQWQAGTTDLARETALTQMIGQMQSWVGLQGSGTLLPSLSVPLQSRSEMYLQFPERCDERFDIAQRLVTFSLVGVEGAPVAVVSQDRIEPGLATIDLRGPHWRN